MTLPFSLLLGALLGAIMAQAEPPPVATPAAPPSASQPPFTAPTVPIDQRIDTAKITIVDAPSLPRAIIQPLPAIDRIAMRPEQVPIAPETYTKARAAIELGLTALRQSQRPSGAWMEKEVVQPTDQPRASSAALAVTALGAKAFLQARPDDPVAKRAMDFVIGRVRGEGYAKLAESGVGTYVTSAVLSALAAADSELYADEMRGAIDWLRETQWDQSEGLSPSQDWFGGSGYGRNKRPDLSNTQLMLDALHDAGVSPDDPAVQRALAFVARTQNLPSTNPSDWAKAGTGDGGFIYTPANGGESFASDKAGEGRAGEKMPAGQPRSLRSYGSMTYAGFKSLLYAGLSKDDPRVKAAYDWIRRHYTFEENPGLGLDGLYYYYHAMARALLAGQQHFIATISGDEKPNERNWREDLIAAIIAKQRPDGTWVNTSERWEESQPDLVTIYSILALEEAIKPVLRAE